MPTVEFSPQQSNNMALISTNGGIFINLVSASPSQSVLGSSQAKLVLFSGSIPAQPRLMTASRFSDALAYWSITTETSTFTASTTTTITTDYKAAIATATATWFAFCWYNALPPLTSGSLQQRIIGTVGTIGSGEDLEMATPSIVTGSQYRIYNFRLTLPSSYTY